MNLQLVPLTHIDAVWKSVKPLLEKAVIKNHGEASLDQVKMQLSQGDAHLIIASENDTLGGAAVIEFVQHPNVRVAHVSYAGGKGIITEEVMAQLGSWAKSMGASELRTLCGESQARLFSRVGYHEIYRMMKVAL